MKLKKTSIPEVLVLEPKIFGDDRGFFLERWNRDLFETIGLKLQFAQISHSSSGAGILRGLHYQEPKGQGKLVWVIRGRVFDVAADIRIGSATFAKHVSIELSEDNLQALWIPPGFAHGFAVLSERADLMYAITDNTYNPACDRGIRWNDPDLAIDWPLDAPRLSEKDAKAPLLCESPKLPTV